MRHISILLLMSMFVSLGCESSADVAHPKQYTRNGIAFSYPGNWTVESDEVDPTGFRTIIIETPGDGLAMVQHFEDPPAIGLQAYAEMFSELTRQEVPFGQISASQYKPYTHKKGGRQFEGVQESFDMTLLGERIPHARGFFGFDDQLPQTVMICQVASEDLGKVRPGCDLVLEKLTVTMP